MRQLTVEDALIDLRTCLEAALLHEANAELAYQVAIRGAWLVGRDASSRKDVFDQLKRAYDLGSKAIHTGYIKDDQKRVWPQIRDAQRLTQRIMRLLIKHSGNLDLKRIVFGKTTRGRNATTLSTATTGPR
jgi:hypothetical protein